MRCGREPTRVQFGGPGGGGARLGRLALGGHGDGEGVRGVDAEDLPDGLVGQLCPLVERGDLVHGRPRVGLLRSLPHRDLGVLERLLRAVRGQFQQQLGELPSGAPGIRIDADRQALRRLGLLEPAQVAQGVAADEVRVEEARFEPQGLQRGGEGLGVPAQGQPALAEQAPRLVVVGVLGEAAADRFPRLLRAHHLVEHPGPLDLRVCRHSLRFFFR